MDGHVFYVLLPWGQVYTCISMDLEGETSRYLLISSSCTYTRNVNSVQCHSVDFILKKTTVLPLSGFIRITCQCDLYHLHPTFIK